MRKFIFYIVSVLFIQFSTGQINPTLVDIPHEVFINGGSDNFNLILSQDKSLAEKVKTLHSYNELAHDLTVQTSLFKDYWERYKNQWHYIYFKDKTAPLLIFLGLRNEADEREYVEIYDIEAERNHHLLFSETGKLLAYKEHPYTKELILYVHKYPCCKSASHNIYKIRQLDKKLQVKDRFFVGRDAGDMVGPFFPDKVKHNNQYEFLTQRTELRWSPAIVEQKAFEGWTESNLIIHYNKAAMYKILHDNGNWLFVIFFNGIAHEQSMMLNYTNFENKGVYGWIKKQM